VAATKLKGKNQVVESKKGGEKMAMDLQHCGERRNNALVVLRVRFARVNESYQNKTDREKKKTGASREISNVSGKKEKTKFGLG